jgi:hypothetical protein
MTCHVSFFITSNRHSILYLKNCYYYCSYFKKSDCWPGRRLNKQEMTERPYYCIVTHIYTQDVLYANIINIYTIYNFGLLWLLCLLAVVPCRAVPCSFLFLLFLPIVRFSPHLAHAHALSHSHSCSYIFFSNQSLYREILNGKKSTPCQDRISEYTRWIVYRVLFWFG